MRYTEFKLATDGKAGTAQKSTWIENEGTHENKYFFLQNKLKKFKFEAWRVFNAFSIIFLLIFLSDRWIHMCKSIGLNFFTNDYNINQLIE